MVKEKDPNRFYVYLHRRASDNEVFYVGKGSGIRATRPHGRSKWWHSIKNKHGFLVEYVEKGLSEESAFDLEVETIKFYRDNGHKLCNLTDGGEGASGNVISEETRKKMSDANKGKPLSDKVRKILDELRNKQSVICSNGMIFPLIKDAAAWIEATSDYKINNASHIGGACRGEKISAYGYKWRYYNDGKIIDEDGLWEPLKVKDRVYCSNGMDFKTCYDGTLWLRENWFPKAQASLVTKCCKGQAQSAYGFLWSYKDEFKDKTHNEPVLAKRSRWADMATLSNPLLD